MSTTGEFQIRLSSGRLIALPRGARVSAYELSGGWGERSGVISAEVSEDSHNPQELGLRNLTAQPWIAIIPTGERQQIDPGWSVRLQAGAQVNFGATYGEIVDPNAPAQEPWQRGGAVASPRGNFVAMHWRGNLSLPMSFWINGVLFGLVWRLLPYSLFFYQRIAGLRSGIWTIFGAIFCGIIGAILTIWTIVGIWRSSGAYEGHAVWPILACIAAGLMAIMSVVQLALAIRPFAL
jgi:hypothetical protein